MPVLKSSSTALHAERPVLAPGWLIALMAAMVCVALWLLYPRQDLERRLSDTTESALSLSYLNNLLRSDPDNPRLRLLLAQRQMANGNAADARATLQPALDSSQPEIHRDALWVLWELTYTEYQRTPEKDSARRDALRQTLREQLHVLAREKWPVERQRRLVTLAAQFNEPALGIALNSSLAAEQTTPREAAQFYERAARQALAVSDYASCAEFYLLARKATTDPQQAKRLFLAAVRALQSGNQPLAALELAEREVGALIDDPEILFFSDRTGPIRRQTRCGRPLYPPAPASGPAAPVAKPYCAGLQFQGHRPRILRRIAACILARDAAPPAPARDGLRRRRTVAGPDRHPGRRPPQRGPHPGARGTSSAAQRSPLSRPAV